MVKLLRSPAKTFGLLTAQFELQAVWSSGSNALAGQAVPNATLEVQLPGTSIWQLLCAGSDATCNNTCTGTGCSYTYALPTASSAQYVISFRAVLSGAPGDALALSWSFLRCDTTQYANINDTDGAVVCEPCPVGGNCAVKDVTRLTDVVALQGYWASPSSDGLVFYKCPVPEACLPGTNGTRATCGCHAMTSNNLIAVQGLP